MMVADLFARFSADTTQYEKQMRSVVTKMLFAAESFTQAGRVMTAGITLPMAAVGAAALKMAMKFESAMVRMETLVGMQASEMAGWADQVKRMAGEVGKSAVELAEALFFITSAGIRDAKALDVLENSAKAASVGLGETKDVAFAAVSAMNAYGQANLAAGDAVGVLIRTVREGNLEAKTLPMAFGRLLPIAAAMGIEFHEAGAGIAAMTRAGVSARLAAFGLRAVMLSLLAPTKGARKAADQMGLSFEHLAQVAREEGVIYALNQMKDATDAHGRSLKDLIPSHRAFTAALQLVGENSEDVIKIFGELKKSSEQDVEDTFNRAAETTEITLAQAMGKLSAAAIDLGENLAFVVDHFAGLADVAASAASLFNSMPNWFKDTATALGSVVFALGPIMYGLGQLARMTARFVGLNILFRTSWASNTAALMAGGDAALFASTKFNVLGVSIGKLMGMGIGAFFVGWGVGSLINELTGLERWLNKIAAFKKPAEEIGNVFEKDAARMNVAATAAHELAMKIGAVEEARMLEASVAANNAQVTSRTITLINELAAAYNKAHIEVDGLTEAEEEAARKREQEAEALRLAEEQNKEYIKGLKDTYDLLTGPEVLENLKELVRHERELTSETGNRKVVLEKMKDDVKEQLEWAKKYNTEVPQGIREMYAAMQQEGVVAQGEWDDLFERLDKHVDAQPGKVIAGFSQAGKAIEDTLKGGFDRGFAEGTNKWTAYDMQLQNALNASLRGGFGMGFDAFRTEVQSIVDEMTPMEVPIVPNRDIWVQFFYDLADGRYPDTGG